MTEESTIRRGKLSDAMQKASESNPENRVLTNTMATDSEDVQVYTNESETEYTESDDATENDSQDDSQIYFGFGSLYAPRGFVSADYFEMFDEALSMQIPVSQNSEIALYGGYQFRNIRYASSTYTSTHGVSSLYFAAHVLYRPWAGIRFFSPYLFAGGGGRLMFWNYTHPIKSVVTDTNGNVISVDTISSDSLGGVILSAGTGISLLNTDLVRWNLKVQGDFTVNGGVTHEGFDNDFFGADADLAFGTELLFHF